MPLVRVAMRRGKSGDYRKAILEGVYEAMRETFNVPEDDRFMLIDEYDAGNYEFSRSWDDLIEPEAAFRQQLSIFLGGPFLSTCHDQHDMLYFNAGPTLGIKPTHFFVRGWYDPGNVATSNSAAQFCRSCHGGESNEAHGQTIPTT